MSAPRVRPPEAARPDPITGSALGHQPEALLAFLKLYGTLWSHGSRSGDQGAGAHPQRAHRELHDLQEHPLRGARRKGSPRSSWKIRDGFETSDAARAEGRARWTDTFLATPEPDPRSAARCSRSSRRPSWSSSTAGLALFMGFSKIAVSLGGMPESLPVNVQPTPDWPPTAAGGA